jgi:UDP-N-acetylmuramyl pentapeptide phosphotransferase/UDP-N-acetylglucosamine-1-phosphate transferase
MLDLFQDKNRKLDAQMDRELTVSSILGGAAILIAAALLCVVLILLLRPLLARYAIVQPNERSSHTIPTPQGGGIAVIAAALGVSGATLYFFPIGATAVAQLLLVFVAVVFIAGVGALADIHPENVALRLLLQTLAVTAVIFVLPPGLRILPILPLGAERVALVIGGLWFVNLVNFMDGLDWMTAAETVPIAAALAVIGLIGTLPPMAVIVSLALCGAMIGFGYFNRPVAKLFLGDVGSLPVGLLLGWLLVLLAGNGARAAAILLPLYYLADSTITLVRRARNGETIWRAHRSHFYQRATDLGFAVIDVVARVFAVNVALATLAILTVIVRSRIIDTAALSIGAVLVAGLLCTLSRGRITE